MEDLEKEQESFWNMERIMPKHIGRFSDRCEPVEIISDGPESAAGEPIPQCGHSEATGAVRRSASPERIAHYTDPHPLILYVDITKRNPFAGFYERFASDARRYFSVRGEPCPIVPYFSYMPQYTQMEHAQKECYFWWRESFRHGNFLDIPFSYQLLYIYEILNLTPDDIPPEQGLNDLITLWSAYRGNFPVLDRYLAEWVCDYCLLYHLALPASFSADLRLAGIRYCSLREFYLTGSETGAELSYLSDYDYHKSKFYKTFQTEYDTHIPAAVRAAGSKWLFDSKICDSQRTAITLREGFSGALLCGSKKRFLQIEFRPLTRLPLPRRAATALYKYAENALRRILGIRSRLSVIGLPDGADTAIDRYFAPFIPQKQPDPEPEYMALYESSSNTLSTEHAKKLERDSWQVTAMLTADRISEETAEEITEETPDALPDESDTRISPSAVLSMQAQAAQSLLQGDLSGFSAIANRLGILEITLAESINEAVYDRVGDIVVEGDGMAAPFSVISCYAAELEEWIRDTGNQS